MWESSLKYPHGARLAVVGWASNVQPSVKTNYTLLKGLTILGCRAGESPQGFCKPASAYENIVQWARKLKPMFPTPSYWRMFKLPSDCIQGGSRKGKSSS